MSNLWQTGERHLINTLRDMLGTGQGVVAGIGDDCAVVACQGDAGHDWVLTSDPVIEGVHFTAAAQAKDVGHKAVARVLSDMAAMGAEPSWALINLVAPGDTPVKRVEAIYRGAAGVAQQHGLTIVGGDTAEGQVLQLHVFGIGRVPKGKAVLRSGAQSGDIVYVTGTLGQGAGGRHLTFDPRVQEGCWLRQRGWASALIDVSDGLSSDLCRLTEMSNTGAEIQIPSIPLEHAHPSEQPGQPAIDRALSDGEDYELLFTVAARKKKRFEAAWQRKFALRLSAVGVMTDQVGIIDYVGGDTAGADHGYEHFTGGATKTG